MNNVRGSGPNGIQADDDGLPAPDGVTLSHAEEGGWAIVILWEYGYRSSEVHHFEVNRRMQGLDSWTTVATNINSDSRTWVDIQPGSSAQYTYTVTAVGYDGTRATSSEPSGEAGTPYIAADPGTAMPTGIRKPLPSTRQQVFVAWDPHPQASAYRLEALDDTGAAYACVHIRNPKMPVGLLLGAHPADRFTARVCILRRGADGKDYDASYADAEIILDEVNEAHLTVYDLYAQEPEIAANRTHGVILGLAEGTRPAPIVVNGIPNEEAWSRRGNRYSAIIQYVAPMGTGITATVCVRDPTGDR